MEVTLNLSEPVFQHISQIAKTSKSSIGEVIENAFEHKFAEETETLKESVKFCTDAEVLQLANLMLPEKQDKQLSLLLRKNGETSLSKSNQHKLESLMSVYRIYLLRKAIGTAEAATRGLMKPSNL
jgi:hypothetical protein